MTRPRRDEPELVWGAGAAPPATRENGRQIGNSSKRGRWQTSKSTSPNCDDRDPPEQLENPGPGDGRCSGTARFGRDDEDDTDEARSKRPRTEATQPTTQPAGRTGLGQPRRRDISKNGPSRTGKSTARVAAIEATPPKEDPDPELAGGSSISPPAFHANKDPPPKRNQRFACPFYRKNFQKYQSCSGFDLFRIKDIKQHLQRKHKRPTISCPRCHEGFETTEARDVHAGHASCAEQPKPDGIDDSHLRELKEKKYVSRGRGPEEQWNDIWDTVFPDHKDRRPRSVYIGNAVEESTRQIRSYWDGMRDTILARVRGAGQDSWSDSDGFAKIIEAAMATTFDLIESPPTAVQATAEAQNPPHVLAVDNSTGPTSCEVPAASESRSPTTADQDDWKDPFAGLEAPKAWDWPFCDHDAGLSFDSSSTESSPQASSIQSPDLVSGWPETTVGPGKWLAEPCGMEYDGIFLEFQDASCPVYFDNLWPDSGPPAWTSEDDPSIRLDAPSDFYGQGGAEVDVVPESYLLWDAAPRLPLRSPLLGTGGPEQ